MSNSTYYRDAIANWDFFSDVYKDENGVRPSYSFFKAQAEKEARRADPNHTEVWHDFAGNPVVVRFVDGEAVPVTD